MSKGDDTRALILRQASDLASEVGISGLTLGALAERSGLSKSGLFAHFRLGTGAETFGQLFTDLDLCFGFRFIEDL